MKLFHIVFVATDGSTKFAIFICVIDFSLSSPFGCRSTRHLKLIYKTVLAIKEKPNIKSSETKRKVARKDGHKNFALNHSLWWNFHSVNILQRIPVCPNNKMPNSKRYIRHAIYTCAGSSFVLWIGNFPFHCNLRGMQNIFENESSKM